MGIPKPLVQFNQAFIVASVVLSFFTTTWVLLAPFIVGVITLLTKQNPIMKVGKQFLRKEASFYPLEDRDQQLFNQWIATSCLGLSLLFFMVNLPVVSAAFSIMVLIAAGVALMGYCIGCTIRYRYMMWKYKRKKQKQAA
ncbi:DUF4395 domain-containing protein [Priestia flexa]|uniref:DUF4395 domain-containing protein n=1 Tax=Priestia flexa TaxID=86664 RepID=UPI00099C6033|nr:DUF4395 domain-containing protein [Priestia flexa]AQX54672.1 hypothetical protein BC359_10355 [Priestia flexa]MCM3068138.1 DUF4395 domain-containing protein [Priestia flexa]